MLFDIFEGMKRLFVIFSLSVCSICSLHAQSIYGTWKTIDDNTGKPRAIVDIFERDGQVFGKITEIFLDPGDPEFPLCDKCDGNDKDRPIVGMEIIRGMEKDGETWEEGTILDADTGRTYDCKLWLEDGNLMVRGYVAFFYRTQTWVRAAD